MPARSRSVDRRRHAGEMASRPDSLRLNELPSQIAPLRFSLVREEEKEQKRIKINQSLQPQTNRQSDRGFTSRVGRGKIEKEGVIRLILRSRRGGVDRQFRTGRGAVDSILFRLCNGLSSDMSPLWKDLSSCQIMA